LLAKLAESGNVASKAKTWAAHSHIQPTLGGWKIFSHVVIPISELFVSVYALRRLHNKNMNYGQRPRVLLITAPLLLLRTQPIYLLRHGEKATRRSASEAKMQMLK
jgi:hypothetical protein